MLEWIKNIGVVLGVLAFGMLLVTLPPPYIFYLCWFVVVCCFIAYFLVCVVYNV